MDFRSLVAALPEKKGTIYTFERGKAVRHSHAALYAAAAVYAAVQADPSPSLALFFSFGPLLAVILWLQKDARRTGVASVLDLGFFLWLAWPIVIPWYAFKTRGSAGWRLLLGLFALISSAYLGWLTTAWVIYGVRYAWWYFGAGA